MASHKEDVFKRTGTTKELVIQSTNFGFSNDDFISESFTYKQSLCSNSELKFGSCESSSVSFSVVNDGGASLVGEEFTIWFKVKSTVDGRAEIDTANIGTFKIITDEISSDRRTRKIEAVDSMYYMLNENVSDWYNDLTFPMPLLSFRNALFEHFASKGTFYPTQKNIELINDDMMVYKTLDTNDLSGSTVLNAICELNGVFGRLSDRNVFEYVSLVKTYGVMDLYPAEDLYPGNDLYPSSRTIDDEYVFDLDEYYSIDYANYKSKPIDRVIVRMEENDIGATATNGGTDNTYTVEGNFLVYGMDSTNLEVVAYNLLSVIEGITYTPIKSASTYGNPYIKVGSAIGFILPNRKYIKSYMLERTLTGIQALKDNYVANGVENYEYTENNTNTFLNQLRAKTAKVEATVDGVSIAVSDLAEDTEAKLELKVSTDDNDQVVSMINASADVITLNSNRLVVDSDNFKLDRTGNVQATGTFKTNASSNPAYCEIKGNCIEIHEDLTQNIIARIGGINPSTTVLNQTMGTLNYDYTNGLGFIIGAHDSNTKRVAQEYVINNGFNPYGHTEKHVFQGNARFRNNIMIGSGNGGLYPTTWSNLPCIAVGQSSANTGLYVYGNFTVTGTKNRAVDTNNYGTVAMNAYETAYAQFGDNGSGACDSKGICEIEFEPIFAETIDLSKPYQVFLTQTSEKTTSWVEKKADRFIVHGEPNATFDYMIVARQKDYADVRLEKIEIPNIESEVKE